jgi:hypothetical protein
MQYYAINEIELKQFHMAAKVAGGSKEVVPVLDSIRKRKISYKNIEASNSAEVKPVSGSLPEYREHNTTKNKIKPCTNKKCRCYQTLLGSGCHYFYSYELPNCCLDYRA